MKLMIAVATVAAALAIATSSVSAQTATTDPAATSTAVPTTSSTAYTAARTQPRTDANAQMVSEALERSKARHQKFLATGTPEQWGSEEPFVFDPVAAPVK